MKILGIDIETTSLDVEATEIWEVGAILWDTERSIPLIQYSEIWDTKNPIPDGPYNPNLTAKEMIMYSLDQSGEIRTLKEFWITQADAICAHKGHKFDRPILERYGFDPDKVWIDTIEDLPFSPLIKARGLTALAAEHGFPLSL